MAKYRDYDPKSHEDLVEFLASVATLKTSLTTVENIKRAVADNLKAMESKNSEALRILAVLFAAAINAAIMMEQIDEMNARGKFRSGEYLNLCNLMKSLHDLRAHCLKHGPL